MYYPILPLSKDKKHPVLGEGHQKVTQQLTGSKGAKVTDEVAHVEEHPIRETHLKISCISNFEQDSFGISGHAKGSTPPLLAVPSIKAELEAKYSRTHTQSNFYAVITVEQTVKSKRLVGPRLTTEAKDDLSHNRLYQFYSRFGEEFVNQVIYGKRLLVVLKLSSDKLEKKTELTGSGGVDQKVVSAEAGGQLLLDHLKETKIEDKVAFAIGSETTWDFSSYEDLTKKLKEHMESTYDTEIGYETLPYTSAGNLPDNSASKLESLEDKVKKENGKIHADAEKYLKKVAAIVDEHNIAISNPTAAKTTDTKYLSLQRYKQQCKEHLGKLEEILADLDSKKRILSPEKYKEYQNTIAAAKQWYDGNKKELKDASNHAFLKSIDLSDSTQSLKIPVPPQKISGKTKYYFLQFADHNGVEYTIGQRQAKHIWIATPIMKKLTGSGTYIELGTNELEHLTIMIPKGVDPKKLTLNIYAATKELKGYSVGKFTDESVDSKLHRADGAAGAYKPSAQFVDKQDEFKASDYVEYKVVIDKESSQKDGYVQYKTASNTDAALLANLGLRIKSNTSVAESRSPAVDGKPAAQEIRSDTRISLNSSGY